MRLPHGFSELSDASQPEQRRGPNGNRLAPADRIDGLSGTATLNAIPSRSLGSGESD